MNLFFQGRIHFIGIGGAGMSAIAKVLLERGHEVSGSDLKRSQAATVLEAMGASVHIGHRADLVEGAGVVVASSAIAASNPELERARALGIGVMSRGEALAAVLGTGRPIVVAGTHGKTTTTSMIVSTLLSAGRDPTYLVGGGLNDAGTNARSGKDDVAVAESDESDGSFLLLHPHIAVVTNLEADHLDHWGTFESLADGFRRFLYAVQEEGTAIVPADDDALTAHARDSGRKVMTFGSGGDVMAIEPAPEAGGTAFELSSGTERRTVVLRVPGSHNVENALAAAAACLSAGCSLDEVATGLSSFRGVERRFQFLGTAREVTVVDDYAHHPTEVKATLAATRPGPWRRVVAVFQPHRYSRTAALWRDFGAAFEPADRVVVTDVYGAGEMPVPGISGKLIADAVCANWPGRPVAYLPHREELVDYLISSARSGDLLLTLGAGDITGVGDQILARLRKSPVRLRQTPRGRS